MDLLTSKPLKRKEAKTVTFRIVDANGDPVDCTAAEFSFAIKENMTDTTAVVSKVDADFTKTGAAVGVVSVVLTEDDLDRVGTFVCDLKTEFSATNIDKSKTYKLNIIEAVID